MANRDVRTFFSGGAYFEGPRWRDGNWWVSDFYRHTVSTITPDGRETVIVEVEQQPSGLGWLPDGALVISSMKDHRLLRFAGDGLTPLADLTEHCGGHLNDLVIDAVGRIYVGDFGFDIMAGAAPATTSLKRVDPDGTVTIVADGLHFPNGSVITPDGTTLIVGETLGNRYTAFDISPDGSLTNRRIWAEFGAIPTGTTTEEVIPQLAVAPDGCSLDAEGHIWAADAVGGRVVRVAPGGAVVDEIRAPDGLGVYACALGGDDGRTLLMCAAPDFYEHLRAPTREAVLLAVGVDVPHSGRP
ncbi:SMP-30/gluconolactonase/LRE family protein [Cryptosporangium minutisporangium]|uniref:SMP-30/gluconolactonase/LRE family protein n=1 Tax=Cryptosporangium minutisporangium TaxID=113569 RepID=A0ABP6SYH6_9ACTN